MRKSFQMIGAFPFLPNGNVDMASRDFFIQSFLLRCLPLLTKWTTPGLGLPHETLSLTIGPRTSGMLPSSDFPEAPTSQRDGTTGSKAWSAALIWKCLEALMFCNHLMRNPLLQGRKNMSNLILTCRM